MSRKPKPIRQCTTYPEINAQLELAGAVLEHVRGDHAKYKFGQASIMSLTDGNAKHGTRASIIRMARLAGLPILLGLTWLLYVAFQHFLL